MDDRTWWEALCARAGLGGLREFGFLAQGGSNTVYRLATERGVFVVKVSKESVPSRLGNEHAFLSVVDGDFGPRAHFHEDGGAHHGQPLLVMDLVEGTHPYELDARAASELGRAMREIHERPVEPFRGIVDRPDWEAYLRDRVLVQCELARDGAPGDLLEEILGMVERARARGCGLDGRLATHRRTLVHSDVIPLNVLSTASGMVLIDWEWVRIDLPEWDLGSILKAFVMDSTALERFWEAYGLGCDPELLEFTGILHHLNVVAWRLRTFYGLGEYREIAEAFLADLEVELAWLRTRMA